MNCARTINGRVFISLEKSYLLSSEMELLRHPDCCGVVLFSENCQDPTQIADLCLSIRDCRREDLLIGIDREGGRVQRLSSPFTDLPAQSKLGSLYSRHQSHALQLAAQVGWLRCAELRAVGIDFTFAPVLDLDHKRSGVIGDRALSGSPAVVSALGCAMIEGAHKAGAIVVAKHFPGHGYALADSHTDACVDDRRYAGIEMNDLRPFAAAIDARADAVMSAHIHYSRCDEEIATYSSFWTRTVLRERLGFRGLLISDDLGMRGCARPGEDGDRADRIAGRALAALEAGHDIVLVCRDFEAARATLAAVAQWRGRQPAYRRLIGRPDAEDLGWEKLTSSTRYQEARDSLLQLVGRGSGVRTGRKES